MMDLHCTVCGHDLPADAEHSLIYCSHCGAVQLMLGEDLREAAESARQPGAADAPRTERAPSLPGTVEWPALLRMALLSGAAMGVLTLLAVPLPGLGLFSGLWFVASPVVVIGVYRSLYPGSTLSAGVGARVGLVTGMADLAALAVLKVAQFDVLRHAGRLGDFDASWTRIMAESVARAAAMGQDTSVLGSLGNPEFRVGWVLASLAMMAFVLLIMTTVGGAFAGLLRGRQAAPSAR